jgi:dTDP-4-dehydrorhamnose 3,5-epimerase
MKVKQISGVQVKDLFVHEDSRGSFMRILDLAEADVEVSLPQISYSRNIKPYTFRGLHGMKRSASEFKFVSCLRGSLIDYIVDLRPESETYLMHLEIHLDSETPKVVVIPPGCVHGYLTVKSETEILSVMSTPYESINEIGVRFDDPKLGLKLPKSPIDVSQKDLNWPLL